MNSVPYTGHIAAEPGLDYRTLDVEGFDISADVTITDYSTERCSISRIEALEDLQKFFMDDRPTWAKVRWINVNGLNWECVKLLASQYNLHRLAIEDMLSVQRTKADWYHDRI
jgi:Mg2+ and Co2+ transporter CorA